MIHNPECSQFIYPVVYLYLSTIYYQVVLCPVFCFFFCFFRFGLQLKSSQSEQPGRRVLAQPPRSESSAEPCHSHLGVANQRGRTGVNIRASSSGGGEKGGEGMGG